MPRTRPEVSATRHERAVEVGRRVAAARLQAGCTQVAAARALNIPQSALARVELGQRYLSFIEALDLAALYGVPASAFDPRTAEDAPPSKA
jgi:transcriptional regulator with XRE-family HTH domain